jgi:hypothetical protein
LLKKVKKFFARCRILSTFATRSGRKSGTFFEKQVQKEISKKVEIKFTDRNDRINIKRSREAKEKVLLGNRKSCSERAISSYPRQIVC